MVTTQERIDKVPTSASFVGIRMMEEPSILSITAIVSCRQLILGLVTARVVIVLPVSFAK